MTAARAEEELPRGVAARTVRAPEPGTPEDVRRAPRGPAVGAFFDFDGTLVAGFSAAVFARERLRRGQVSGGELLRGLRFAVDAGAGRVDLSDMLGLTARSWAGSDAEQLRATGQRLFEEQLAHRVFPEMRRLVRAHLDQGHTVVLTSSATSYQIDPMAAELGVAHVLCTRLVVEDGVLTGELDGPAPWGPGKSDAVQVFAAAHGIDLDQSFAYADGDEDVPLLHAVGQPRAVNPGRRLAGVAARRGWPVLRLTSRGRTGLAGLARNVLGTAAVLPAAVAGTAIGVARGDKRAGVDAAFPAWVDVLLGVNGVQVDVVGSHHAWAARPCVFVHNHSTNIDSFVVAKVLRGGVVGVGKKEVADNPLGALLAWATDAALIDRSDSAGAVRALAPVVDRLRQGLSVLIAPEGTRSPTGELMPFKKGAFHVALQAGVPVVPVVLRNADTVSASGMMRPGVVQVAVLPPVSTQGWTAEGIGTHVEQVRQLFVDTLADWPG